MTIRLSLAPIAFLILLGLSTSSLANQNPATTSQSSCDLSTTDEIFKSLIKKRKQLETKTKDFRKLMREKENDLKSCTSSSWRQAWESRLDDAKSLRRELESERSEIENLRRLIENNPGPSNTIDYCERMENEVFIGYELYFIGMNGYFKFIDLSVELCRVNDITSIASEILPSALNITLDSILKLKDLRSIKPVQINKSISTNIGAKS